MKKTLFFLALAFWGTMAFAQGNWNKELFTKNAGDILFSTQFLTNDSMVFGHIGNHNIDTTGKYGHFVWVDTSLATYNSAGKPIAYLWCSGTKNYMQSQTNFNGYLLLSNVDDFEEGKYGNYNTYAQFKDSIRTNYVGSIQVSFSQYIRRTADEKYYIEWSHNKTSWNSLLLNDRFADDLAPSATQFMEKYSQKTVTLGDSAANNEYLWIRFRMEGKSTANIPAGDFWAIDDLIVTEGAKYGLSYQRPYFTNFAYHQLPLNVKMLPIQYQVYAVNSGADTAKGVHAMISIPGNTATSTDSIITTGNQKTMYITASKSFALNTATEGPYNLTAEIKSDSASINIDNWEVKVNGGEDNFKRVWARDNGQMSTQGRFVWFYNYATSSFEYNPEAAISKGAGVCLGYQIDASQTEPVYINGIQLVAGIGTTGSPTISPMIITSSESYSPLNNYFYEKQVNNNELNNDLFSSKKSYYADSLKTVDIPIRIGLEMKPGTAYFACYKIAPTTSPSFQKFYLGADGIKPMDTIGNFENPIIPEKKSNFGPGINTIGIINSNTGSMMTFQEALSYTPMIRLLVGPKKDTLSAGFRQMDRTSFSLSTYPNPASEYTTVIYNLPTVATVSLDIFDITGRVINSFNIGKQVAGYKEYKVNVSNFKKGTYFYSLKANGITETKKLIIVR